MANGEDFSQIMADKSQHKPAKGILKTSSSFDKQDKNIKKPSVQKATKWDEMNIIATLHPADKDYGHMKIEEPKTPYSWDVEESDEVDSHAVDPNVLAEKLKSGVVGSQRQKSFTTDSDDSDSDLTPEELARRKVFKSKRKMHYNEFKVVEFARKLIKADEEALANEEDEGASASSYLKIRDEDVDSEANSEEELESIQSESNAEDVNTQLEDCEHGRATSAGDGRVHSLAPCDG